METKKFNLEIERCNNGFLVENKSGKYVFKDCDELVKQLAKGIEEKLNPGEKIIIEYSKDGKQDQDKLRNRG